jgi:hypothetical protein
MTTHDRNPLIIPEATPAKRKGCPACGHNEFLGRRVGGVITWTCRSPTCGNKWQGGLPQEEMDPREPRPPEDPRSKPPVTFEKDSKGQMVEQRRPVNLTQEFRKGAPVPSGEEDV